MYGYLCDLVEANHPAILGAGNANLAKVVETIAEAFVLDALPPEHEVRQRMVNIVKQVQVRGCTVELLWMRLNPGKNISCRAIQKLSRLVSSH